MSCAIRTMESLRRSDTRSPRSDVFEKRECKSKPIKCEANKEIIKKIAKYFAISTTAIEIKSGHKSKEKIIEISQ